MIQFVENCSYWIVISAGLVYLVDFQQRWICGKISRKGSVVLRGTGNEKGVGELLCKWVAKASHYW